MNWFLRMLTSSIGQKLIMSLTGLFLVSFLLVHVSGNLQLFYKDGGAAFNIYTRFMTTSPIIKVLEWGLLLGFGLHIYTAAALTRRNASARPVSYAKAHSNSKVSWFAKNMGLSGTIILVFLVVHLMNFWYAYHYTEIPVMTVEGEELKDMYAVVKAVFSEAPWYSVLYIGSMVLLAFHLNHGFQSGFRTLGLDHKKYTPLVEGLGLVISVIIPTLFALMPIYFWFFV